MKFSNADANRSDILGNPQDSREPVVDAAAVRSWRRKVGYLSMFGGAAVLCGAHVQDVSASETAKPLPPKVRQAAEMIKKFKGVCGKPELLRRQSEYRLPDQRGSFDMFSVLAGGDNCPGNAIPSGTYTSAAPFTDTGNTTGANATVDYAGPNCIQGDEGVFLLQAAGPDHIYSFTLTARGANPEIRVTPGNSVYDTSIYILKATGDACPAGIFNGTPDHPVNSCTVGSDRVFEGSAEVLDASKINTLPLNVPLYLFVDSFYDSAEGPISSGPYTVRIQDVTISNGITPPSTDAPADMDGDGKSDYVVLRNTGGGTSGQVTWWTYLQNGSFFPRDWGLASDQFFTEDFDGDFKDDFAVFRPGAQGTFYIILSQSNTVYVDQFGQTGDDPTVVGDYNGDGRADLAVYRSGAGATDQSFWYWRSLNSGTFNAVPWGLGTDTPAPGDYNGDGKNDFVIQRPQGSDGLFWKLINTTGQISNEVFGRATDTVVPGDYDGDGKTDLAVVRDESNSLVWEFEPSGTAGSTVVRDVWGVSSTDYPAQGDYNGDGKTDYAVWRPGNPATFYVMTAGTRNIFSQNWGLANDVPLLNFNSH